MSGPLTPGSRLNPLSPQDPSIQLNTFKSYVAIIGDPNFNAVDKKLKAAQELCENFELIVANPGYPQFISDSIKVFLKVLQETEPIFVSENTNQQLRKIMLELIHRVPSNEHIKPFVSQILSLMFKLLECDCEENVLVCLRVIIELNKQFRPPNNQDVLNFLKYVKSIYENLPNHLNKLFQHKPQIEVSDMSELDVKSKLEEILTVTTIVTEKKNSENQNITYNLMPKADKSLKVLAELPIIVVLMYQLYKQQVHQQVADFIPLIMATINMQPTLAQRKSDQFNKEVFVDFVAAQIKTLSFLAYIIRIYQGAISEHSEMMVNGMLELLTICPPEVAHLRKELLIAARHILATDLKNSFIQHIGKLFDESILIGNGWTTYESLRPLAYSTLADLVHHIRQNLSLSDLSLAVDLFSKNVHDESLPCSIQNMSCKLLLNLVESIRSRSEAENGNGRELFLRMLEVFVLKFKVIAQVQLPNLLTKCKNSESKTSTCGSPQKTQPSKDASEKEEKNKWSLGTPQPPANSVADCRVLVKTLVSGVKTITWGISSCKTPAMDVSLVQNKQFLSKETLVYVRLVKHALVALDIYTITTTPQGQPQIRSPSTMQAVRTKEEKEVLEHLAGVFIMMNQLTFKEIFATMVHYMVNRIHSNYALQIIANSFLASPTTSATFATILVEYLLGHMEEMGSINTDKSGLYLKLFKLVFGSVSLLANENEQMLKPHLNTIVTRSMELARTAYEPYNYFLLLRALFRSIGGGSHDLLYQEFLPLLPNLLQGLNSLQGGVHKQQLKDLFVELCLTVPVRLSSLLPYLPMLMDPLVSALNGSQTLVSQGLRTLELCVDNLQPDFLFSHIDPVKEQLMQSLWKCLSNNNDSTALVAFRVLGKFGGSNRKMLHAPQKLETREFDSPPPALNIHFLEYSSPISFPVHHAIQTSLSFLKSSSSSSSSTSSGSNSPSNDLFYQRHAWNFIKQYLISTMFSFSSSTSTSSSSSSSSSFSLPFNLSPFLSVKSLEKFFTINEISNNFNSNFPPLRFSSDPQIRNLHRDALISMFVACSIKELGDEDLFPFMEGLLLYYTLLSILTQYRTSGDQSQKEEGLDPFILIDAIVSIIGSEEKDWSSVGLVAMATVFKTSVVILGSVEKACNLSIFEHFSSRVVFMCSDRAWYNKMGSCLCIKFIIKNFSHNFLLSHQLTYLKALIFVINDLSGEVSNGALITAKEATKDLCEKCGKVWEGAEQLEVSGKSSSDLVRELCKQIYSPNQVLREHVMDLLKSLAGSLGKSVSKLVEPHKEVFTDVISPKKQLLRYQPFLTQIGIMEANAFCLSLEPRLITLDLSISEHELFYNELKNLCETEDSNLIRTHCFKNINDFVPLKISAIKVLSACHFLSPTQTSVFSILYKFLNSQNPQLQTVAFYSLKKYVTGVQLDMLMVHNAMRPLLQFLSDYSNLTLHRIKVLTDLTQIFPNTFNEKLCEQMLTHLRKWLEHLSAPQRLAQVRITGHIISNEQEICSSIIEMFHLIPAASMKMVEPLISLVLKGEKELFIEANSSFRKPLLKFLIRYPEASFDFFFSEGRLSDVHCNRLFKWLLLQEEGSCFQNYLKNNPDLLLNLINIQNNRSEDEKEQQLLGLSIIHILTLEDPRWLGNQSALVVRLLSVWASKEFHHYHQNIGKVEHTHWQTPNLLLFTLLSFFKQHPNELELLFQMLQCFVGRYIPQFTFFKEFLEETVAKGYSVEWKRDTFFKFVDIFHQSEWSQDIKAKIIQYILIPCFSHCLEEGEGEALIGGVPCPEQESEDNIISIFITKVIDPDRPFGTSDSVRILLLQLSSLFVEKASKYIHDATNKKQGSKLRRLMTFAWPCLLTKVCVDPATKYFGHLLLAHIIAKFAIHKRIVLQVFHSLLKAHAVEARTVVKQALDVLTPAMPGRMEDENNMLTHWTKKIIIEDGHTVAQLVHILQLIVRHHKVYFLVRHHLTQNISTSIQRLGLTPTATTEQRRLAVDLAEVIINWEVQRNKEEADEGAKQGTSDSWRCVDKTHCDTVVNFLLRIACQATDVAGSPGDQLSKRCIALFKKALSPSIWPHADLKLNWFDKILTSIEGQQPNLNSICTSIELLTFLTTILKKENILSSFKCLQRGVVACMTSSNIRVVRSIHQLLSSLMNIFPTEPLASSVASKHEELENLYACVSKLVYEGLASYEKMGSSTPSQLFGTLMILKAACQNNPSYIDRLITSFMRVLQKMVRDHFSSSQNSPNGSNSSESGGIASELLILGLDLVKNRTGVMHTDMRKCYLASILVGLIEKSNDSKIIKTIIKIIEQWIKNKSPAQTNQLPTAREKSFLLNKLMTNVEKRFPDDLELNAQFLELIHYLYSDESFKNSDITSKLEQAFLAGLRCHQPHIRSLFVKLFDQSVNRRLYDRLVYIVCTQNWEPMGNQYWIKQCIELILNCTDTSKPGSLAQWTHLLPLPPTVLGLSQGLQDSSPSLSRSKKKTTFSQGLPSVEDILKEVEEGTEEEWKKNSFQKIFQKLFSLAEISQKINMAETMESLIQLCQNSSIMAHQTWLLLFPSLWKLLTDRMQSNLSKELVLFLSSGNHLTQRDCHPSAVRTFVEAMSNCSPPIYIRPCILSYLSKSHGFWHLGLLLLEKEAFSQNMLGSQLFSKHSTSSTSFSPYQLETLNAMLDLYKLLKEEDMLAGVWMKRARHPHTLPALTFEQFGLFNQAQAEYEKAMAEARQDFNSNPVSPADIPEYNLWEDHWIRCTKELNQWEVLLQYSQSVGNNNHLLILESSWRFSNWSVTSEALQQVEGNCPRDQMWKMSMYKGYLAICLPEEQSLQQVEKMVETGSVLAIREWRRLPRIVSSAHIPLLQAAQQLVELQEAGSLRSSMQPSSLSKEQTSNDIKAIIKTWKNRMPSLTDDLSHWGDVFTWRQQHFSAITDTFDQLTSSDPQQQNVSMLGVHHTAVGMVEFGKIARKQLLSNVCLESLNKIHSIASVPVYDCFHKIRQQVKCYLEMAGSMGRSELQEGLEVIESTTFKYFNKEMVSEFYALKGLFLTQIGKSEEANKSFSAAVQMHETQVKGWALWGEYLENIFIREKNITTGKNAITCFLQASRNQNEVKSRKWIAKIFWLLSFDDTNCPLAECLEKFGVSVPPISWLIWIPQLLTCLVRNEGRHFINLLSKIGSIYPQAVYFPTRTMYLTHKIEQKYITARSSEFQPKEPTSSSSSSSSVSTSGPIFSPSSVEQTLQDKTSTAITNIVTSHISTPASSSSSSTFTSTSSSVSSSTSSSEQVAHIKATSSMWRCSRVMHMQRESQTTVLSLLESIVDQMAWFRENWSEEVLHQLKQALSKCYSLAFDYRASVSESVVTQSTLNYIKKLVTTFGTGLESGNSTEPHPSIGSSSAGSESLAKRYRATTQDPIFQKIKIQFSNDFNFNLPGAIKLHNMISKLRKWTKVLEARTNQLQKNIVIEGKCKTLSFFLQNMAEIELPGELLVPQQNNHYIKIDRFLPRVDIAQKLNTSARRLYIRGHNGKIYPYLIMNDGSMAESRREERVFQLLRIINLFLSKQKETSKRLLSFCVPRVVALSPQLRLVQDHPLSISLSDIYKQKCIRRSIEPDLPISRYYEKLATVQSRGGQPSQQNLCDILKDVQTNLVPRSLLKEWVLHTYPQATDYWVFRKNTTIYQGLIGLVEFVLHLTRLNPELLHFHQDSGQVHVAFFKFDIDDQKGDLNGNRPVPFRLTPNLADFMTSTNIVGPLAASMISSSRCFSMPKFRFKSFLCAILRDELINWYKKKEEINNPHSAPSEMSNGLLVQMVTKAVQVIILRLQSLASLEGNENKVGTLVTAANSVDNLCRMDPAWHPWL